MIFFAFVIVLVGFATICEAETYTSGTFQTVEYSADTCTSTSVTEVSGERIGVCQFKGTNEGSSMITQCVTDSSANTLTLTVDEYSTDDCSGNPENKKLETSNRKLGDASNKKAVTKKLKISKKNLKSDDYELTTECEDKTIYSCSSSTETWNDGWQTINLYYKYFGEGDSDCSGDYYYWESSGLGLTDEDSCSLWSDDGCDLNDDDEASDGGYHTEECINSAWSTGVNIALAIVLVISTITAQ